MTIVIVHATDSTWVAPTASLLRDRGGVVLVIATTTILGFLLLSNKVTAVAIDEVRLPRDWERLREEMAQISPGTRIVVISRDDSSTPQQLAHRIINTESAE